MRWKNGLGWTSEIAIAPAEADFAAGAFDWRISLAEVEADSDFSPLPGVDRTIALLEGEGMLLSEGTIETVLARRGQLHGFSGDAAVSCRLLGGACRDFNVMTRRDAYAHRAWFRPLVGPMVFFDEPGVTWVVHVAGGEARVQDAPELPAIAQGETLVLAPGGGAAKQAVIAGGGEVLLVRLEALSS